MTFNVVSSGSVTLSSAVRSATMFGTSDPHPARMVGAHLSARGGNNGKNVRFDIEALLDIGQGPSWVPYGSFFYSLYYGATKGVTDPVPIPEDVPYRIAVTYDGTASVVVTVNLFAIDNITTITWQERVPVFDSFNAYYRGAHQPEVIQLVAYFPVGANNQASGLINVSYGSDSARMDEHNVWDVDQYNDNLADFVVFSPALPMTDANYGVTVAVNGVQVDQTPPITWGVFAT